jgi:hypothetical protein
MNWFERICRNTGLMLHHASGPLRRTTRRQVSRTVEEKRIEPHVTLRRTTIEEIEIHRPEHQRPSSADAKHDGGQ